MIEQQTIGHPYKPEGTERRGIWQVAMFRSFTIDYDRVLVADSTAAPLWARYYDLEHGEPLRDRTIVYGLSKISFDRRVGYDWYGDWPEAVLAAYPAWKAKPPTCP